MIGRPRALLFVVGALFCLTAVPAAAQAETFVFASTGAEQTFTVPAGVTSLHIVAIGGLGGSGSMSLGGPLGAPGGFGATVSGDLGVTPGQVFYVEVARNGIPGDVTAQSAFNGGGSGGWGNGGNGIPGGGGGGASDLRTIPRGSAGSLDSRVVIAAGGGGGGGGSSGGAGGSASANGAAGSNSPGQAGSATVGGAGGGGCGATPSCDGEDGTAGSGGAGGGTGCGTCAGGGGGGGGGLHGGGGGSSATIGSGSGGGGGSSYTAPSLAGVAVAVDTHGTPSITITTTGSGDPGGGPGGPGGGQPPDQTAPVLGSLTLSRRAFQAANLGGSVIPAAVGTTLRYSVSEAATVTFKVSRAAAGRRKGRRCVPPRTAPPGRKCTRYVAVRGTFTHAAASGSNRLKFTGRVRGRALRPGRYRLTAIATDAAGNRSDASVAAFRIVR